MKWLLLITNLPGGHQTLRVRVWRALKSAGAVALRDGVYLLPAVDAARKVFEEQRRELEAADGSAQVIEFDAAAAEQDTGYRALFDRTHDYRKLLSAVAGTRRQLSRLGEAGARRRVSQLSRDLAGLIAVDFFAGAARGQCEAAVADLVAALETTFSTDEPHTTLRDITTVDRRKYRGRTWATRERLWIDRVCSAWLICRLIDPKAKFLWLKKVADCPKGAVGFDFDGAEFTHVGSKVTFEVLVASFGLGDDPGLAALGQLVHFLDVGGVPVPEAPGFAAVVTGARSLHANDTKLLQAVSPVIDSLYAAFAARKDE